LAEYLGGITGRRPKVKAVAVLFLRTILLSGSAAISFMVSGIVLALTLLVILCVLMLLVAFAHFGNKK